MKRIGNLFDKICTIENLRLAHSRATKGKNHYKEVIEFNKNLDLNLHNILNELSTLTYKTSPYYIFNLKTGGKVREIYKLPIRDRIAQHALMNYMEPIFRRSFIEDTYSSIKERGIHRGLKRIKKALKDVEGTKYCLKLDIHKFYPSIDLTLMKNRLRSKFKDKKLLTILDEIVDSTDKGVPIGNYTSLYFANFFLTPMDHYVKEVLKVKYYFRYCDDIVILGPTKEYLRNIYKILSEYIKRIKLEFKPNWQIFPVESRSIDFLGYRSRHKYILVRKYIKLNFIRKLKNAKTFKLYKDVYGSYWGMFCHADCRNLWYKYTGMKDFKELGIKIKSRVSVKDILNKDIIITSFSLKYNRNKYAGTVCAELDGREVKFTTYADMLLEALELIDASEVPFRTKIIEENGFYKFI